jgi:hypothetical protein
VGDGPVSALTSLTIEADELPALIGLLDALPPA